MAVDPEKIKAIPEWRSGLYQRRLQLTSEILNDGKAHVGYSMDQGQLV